MAVGVSYEIFMHLNPKKLDSFYKGYRLRRKLEDERDYNMGIYNLRAVSVSIDHCINGNKAKSEYFKVPILQSVEDTERLTQEEINERELRKMLLYEEMWRKQAKQKGLPETVLK